ncbi:MAG TPA: ArsR family transcriptional regulator [Nitrospirae bacterium]|nr:ArsR family transcriptional regulator [Nitrospirota bacterium]
MRDFLAITKALSDETRIRIMKLLEHGELCVCELMEVLGMGQSTVSKHLGILHSAGLVERRKEGTWSYYRLAEEAVNKYNLLFREVMRQVLNDDKQVKEDLRTLSKLKRKIITCGK